MNRLGEPLGWPEGTFAGDVQREPALENTAVVLEESMLATALLDCAALGGASELDIVRDRDGRVTCQEGTFAPRDEYILKPLGPRVTTGFYERVTENCSRTSDARNLGDVPTRTRGQSADYALDADVNLTTPMDRIVLK